MQKLAIGMMGIHGEIRPHDLLIAWGKIKNVSTWRSSRAQFGLNSAVHKCLYKLESLGICCMHKPDGFTLVFQLIPGAGGSEVAEIVKSAIENIKVTYIMPNDGLVMGVDAAVDGSDKTVTTIHMSKENFFVAVNANEAIGALQGFAESLKNFSVSAAKLSFSIQETRQRMTKRRRYYLHRKIKKFCKVKARQKMVFITQSVHDSLKPKQMNDITELINDGYCVQIEIPN